MGMKNPYPFISTIHIYMKRCDEVYLWVQELTRYDKLLQAMVAVKKCAGQCNSKQSPKWQTMLTTAWDCLCLSDLRLSRLLLHRPLLPWITLGSRCVKWTPSKTLVWWKICQGFPRISLSQTSDIWQTFEDSFDLYNQASSCLSLLHHCK